MLGVPSVCPEVSRTVCHTLIVKQLLGLTVKVAVSYNKGHWWALVLSLTEAGGSCLPINNAVAYSRTITVTLTTWGPA